MTGEFASSIVSHVNVIEETDEQSRQRSHQKEVCYEDHEVQ
jgi:hypothetical protein